MCTVSIERKGKEVQVVSKAGMCVVCAPAAVEAADRQRGVGGSCCGPPPDTARRLVLGPSDAAPRGAARRRVYTARLLIKPINSVNVDKARPVELPLKESTPSSRSQRERFVFLTPGFIQTSTCFSWPKCKENHSFPDMSFPLSRL